MDDKNKEILIDTLNKELKNSHHNARLDFPYDLMDKYGEITETCPYDFIYNNNSMELDYMADGLGLTKKEVYESTNCKQEQYFRNVARFCYENGDLHTWGRSGATLMPKDLINMHGGSSFAIKQFDNDEISMGDAAKLLTQLKTFNKYVADYCSEENLKCLLNDDLKENRLWVYEDELKSIRKSIMELIKELKTVKLPSNICNELKGNVTKYYQEYKTLKSQVIAIKGIKK